MPPWCETVWRVGLPLIEPPSILMRSLLSYLNWRSMIVCGRGFRLSCGIAKAIAGCASLRQVDQMSLVISRSRNFWIFPVEVLGIGANTTWRGTL